MATLGKVPAHAGAVYVRHRPEDTLLYQIVEAHYPTFCDLLEQQGRPLPAYISREFDDFLQCGRLEHGFLRVRCDQCRNEKLVAFSCKRRGFCPSCGARRMVESAALLADEVFPRRPVRQWVLSFPFPLRFLFASHPAVSEKRLSLTNSRQISYQLKTPYRDGTTHVIFNRGGLPPLDFLARLAALVPRPRVNLTRFHGVFARGGHPPNHAWRAKITPGGRGRRRTGSTDSEGDDRTPAERRAAMTWAQRRVTHH